VSVTRNNGGSKRNGSCQNSRVHSDTGESFDAQNDERGERRRKPGAVREVVMDTEVIVGMKGGKSIEAQGERASTVWRTFPSVHPRRLRETRTDATNVMVEMDKDVLVVRGVTMADVDTGTEAEAEAEAGAGIANARTREIGP